MNVLSRFFLLLYVLVVGTSVAAFAGVCLRIIPKKVWQNYLNYIMVQPETIVVLAVICNALFEFSFSYFLLYQKRASGSWRNHLKGRRTWRSQGFS